MSTSPSAIVSAMEGELRSVLSQVEHASSVSAAGREFWCGHWQGRPVVAVLSRIGKVAAATTATALIERFGVAQVLFTGVAGGLGTGVRVGDVVVASHFLQHDLDVSPLFPRHEVPLYGRSRFAADTALSAALHASVQQVLADPQQLLGDPTLREFGLQTPQLHRGLIVSGDRFVATQAESQALNAELPDALAVEMEGAAVAQVCHDYGVPFAAVRTISDRADDSAHHDFKRFMAAVASRYAQAIVGEFLRRMGEQAP
jgi:adenosylhomocysteine nucleosidase